MAAELAIALVGVVGTLAGTLTVTALQHRAARTERTERTDQERRRELVQAVTALVTALAAHRRAMWARERLRLTGADDAVYAEARSESHRTRADITAPLVTLAILAPVLAQAAQDAARATYALRGAADHTALDRARTEAAATSERLVAAAADQLA
ncbi:protein kilB [Kitasatospora sp. NPDC048545]|uniref:protein kilB n=1 Tax=Kitasatospora sp. NPDC048545 TaxID=3157208 RepID=UPI0033FA6555